MKSKHKAITLTDRMKNPQFIGIIESVVGVTLVTVLDLMIPVQLGLQQLDIYLLWVVVLGIAALYGPPAGYIVSILAALAGNILLSLRLDINQPLAPHVQIQPFLFFMCGILVSEVVRRHQRRAHQEEEKRIKVLQLFTQLKENYITLAESKDELERRIMSQPVTVATILEISSKMMNQHLDEMYFSIIEMVHRVMETDSCSLYLMNDQQQLCFKAGQPESWSRRPDILSMNHPIVQHAVRTQSVVTIHDIVTEYGPIEPLTETIFMLGPILAHNDRVIGMLVIERLPFSKMNAISKRTLNLIAQLAAVSLQNTIILEYAKAKA